MRVTWTTDALDHIPASMFDSVMFEGAENMPNRFTRHTGTIIGYSNSFWGGSLVLVADDSDGSLVELDTSKVKVIAEQEGGGDGE